MRIVHWLDAFYPLSGYGGTERVTYYLAKAQAEAGHDVHVFCREGSSLPFATCHPIPAAFRWSDLESSVNRIKGVDFLQLYQSLPEAPAMPYLVNIGGNGRALESYLPNTVFVSRDHAHRHQWSEYVHNGIDPSDYPLHKKLHSQRLLFLAKASWWVKNLAGARRIAIDAKIPLDVVGGEGHSNALVHFHGMIAGPAKLQLLQQASALLFPIIWNEPFGLAVIEALVCGTPVIATRRGALPEILTAETGVLADSHEEFVESLFHLTRFEPDKLRSHVIQNFSHTVMSEKYEKLYKKIIAQGKLREGTAQAPASAKPEEYLPYQGYRPTLKLRLRTLRKQIGL